MLKLHVFFLAAFAGGLCSGAARAEGGVLLALNTPAKPSIARILRELKDPAAARPETVVPGYTDFDALSSVNDPLYRAGSKQLLEQAVKKDVKKKNAPQRTLRDAPISKKAQPGAGGPAKARALKKKTRAAKPIHTDPIKVKNTF